jgi:hypothetical protein
LTQDKRYLDQLKSMPKDLDYMINQMHWRYSPFYMIEMAMDDKVLPEYSAKLKAKLVKVADERLEWQDAKAYRNPFYPPDHGYTRFMGWGGALPLRQARYAVVAWRLTGDKRYRDAALLCNDFNNGCNPMGRSLTSGLGQTYPVRFLDLPSYVDGIEEFVPGITPYYFTYGLDWWSVRAVYSMNWQARPGLGFNGSAISLLPESAVGNGQDVNEMAKRLGNLVPVYRRFNNMEGISVAQNEYTVWETIGPNAAITGCLMGKGWMPSDILKNREPKQSLKELKGYVAQP